jgi:hypothetical protein
LRADVRRRCVEGEGSHHSVSFILLFGKLKMAGNINEFLATKKSALFVEAINQFGRLVDWKNCRMHTNSCNLLEVSH